MEERGDVQSAGWVPGRDVIHLCWFRGGEDVQEDVHCRIGVLFRWAVSALPYQLTLPVDRQESAQDGYAQDDP